MFDFSGWIDEHFVTAHQDGEFIDITITDGTGQVAGALFGAAWGLVRLVFYFFIIFGPFIVWKMLINEYPQILALSFAVSIIPLIFLCFKPRPVISAIKLSLVVSSSIMFFALIIIGYVFDHPELAMGDDFNVWLLPLYLIVCYCTVSFPAIFAGLISGLFDENRLIRQGYAPKPFSASRLAVAYLLLLAWWLGGYAIHFGELGMNRLVFYAEVLIPVLTVWLMMKNLSIVSFVITVLFLIYQLIINIMTSGNWDFYTIIMFILMASAAFVICYFGVINGNGQAKRK